MHRGAGRACRAHTLHHKVCYTMLRRSALCSKCGQFGNLFNASIFVGRQGPSCGVNHARHSKAACAYICTGICDIVSFTRRSYPDQAQEYRPQLHPVRLEEGHGARVPCARMLDMEHKRYSKTAAEAQCPPEQVVLQQAQHQSRSGPTCYSLRA